MKRVLGFYCFVLGVFALCCAIFDVYLVVDGVVQIRMLHCIVGTLLFGTWFALF